MSLAGRVRRAGRRFLSRPAVRRRAAALAERMPALRAMGNAVLGPPPPSTRRIPLDIRPGRMFYGDVQGRSLPIVVVVCLGMRQGDAEELAAAVERAQLTTGSFRPLFVVDGGELAPFRTRGYAVEALMDRETYARLNPHDAHTEYVFERVAAVCAAYRARAVVPLSPAGLAATPDHVLRLIGAVPR